MSRRKRTITWRCDVGHESDLVLPPEGPPPAGKVDSARASHRGGCLHRVRGGSLCGRPVKESGS